MTDLWRRVAVGIAAVGPFGFVPIAPGTAGSAAGLGVWWAVRATGGAGLEIAVLLVVTVVGVVTASATEAQYGRTDPRVIVIDEVAGMLLTLLLVPVGLGGAIVGFVLFRLFDVFKPPPVRQAERLPGGWGVVTDDLVAGLYSQAVLRLLLALGVGL